MYIFAIKRMINKFLNFINKTPIRLYDNNIDVTRSIKLLMILNDFEYQYDHKRFNNCHLSKIIKKLPPDIIITGSFALYIMGLIDRIPKDLDIQVTLEEFKEINIKYTITPENIYANHTEHCVIDGVKVDLILVQEKVDFIKNAGHNYETFEEIIRYKNEYDRNKDIQDINYIINKINGNSKQKS